MYGIIGSVNYKVSLRDPFFTAGSSPEVDEPHRINNVMILNTYFEDGCGKQIEQVNEYHNYAIAFCGKVTNYDQLVSKYGLSAKTEASMLLMLFELKGITMLVELKGVFAFALYDTSNRRLFLVRDRSDDRPLYLYNQNGNFVFSSELNTLVRLTRTRVDYKSLARCIYLGDNYRKSTPYESIVEIENGHYVVIDTLTGTQDDVCWGKGNTRLSPQKDVIC